ncbi:glycosyltransferase 87 family protein [Actinoplanes sp. KI2]|uniref:glycosyltransferase 87 family protein n=1 Tax=Actinoplanes sp. KI2 TaxID=2983315 RepID=UPI0021D5F0DB|nr:glycosyltransferase 87 family protein [Actinoplanes sp. KI2]MCU7722119.1 glycosyltransferase 87 family protein [Actinoplanes sp. KI2]
MNRRAVHLLQRIDRAGDGLTTDLFLYALSAAFALLTALTSTLLPHRAWGAVAVWAYAAAAVVVVVQLATRSTAGRAALAWATGAFAALLPLLIEAVQRAGGRIDRAQEEVLVVEQMGARLLHHGTPYLSREAIAALPADERLMGYSPYQPGMAVFGLPRAIFGDHWWTDARVWFAVVSVAALVIAVRLLPAGPLRVRAIQSVAVLPICALTLATGGDDLPVLTLCLLALALAATGRWGWAGVAVGAAAACKLFAFPVVVVLAAYAVASRRGRSFLPGAVGLPILVLIPPLLIDAAAVVENVLRFPLGHGVVTSPAQSPFPGYLIARHLPGGRFITIALLATVAVVIGIRLLRRPPRTATTAALIIGWGMLAAILLLPTTRFGYLLYPIAFLVWAPALTSDVSHRALSKHTA